MEDRVRLALLLVVTALPISASPQDQDPAAIAQAIATYNRAPEVTSVFRLYEAEPEARLDVPSNSQQLRFKIKETKCQKPVETQNMEKCAFKKSGVVKECTATEHEANTLTVSCNSIIQKTQVRRPRQAKDCNTKNKKQLCKGKGVKLTPKPGLYGPLSPDNV